MCYIRALRKSWYIILLVVPRLSTHVIGMPRRDISHTTGILTKEVQDWNGSVAERGPTADCGGGCHSLVLALQG